MKHGERSDGMRENADGKHDIKEERNCFRQLFRRDFPLRVGFFVLMSILLLRFRSVPVS